MCNPVAIALSLTAAGSAAQAAGARRAAKAMEGARVAESIRQKGFQDEANKVVDESLNKSGRSSTDAAMKAAAEARAADAAAATAEVRKPIEATGENLAGDTSGNKVMATESDLQAARNLGFAGQQGAAKANLLSFNDMTFQNAINNIRAGQQLNTTGNFMRGSAGVLPVELEAASRKGDNLKTLGTVLSTAGTVVGMGAGAGWWDKAAEGATAGANAGAAAGAGAAKPVNISGLNIKPGSISLAPATQGVPNLDDLLFKIKYGNVLNPTNNLFGTPWSNVLKTPIK
jgi:hypothetical protein